jgi:hypothetical protein
MLLPFVLVGMALFLLAFIGLKDFWHIIWGLAALIGLFFAIYYVWQGFVNNNQNSFLGGCFLLMVSAGVLVILKTSADD